MEYSFTDYAPPGGTVYYRLRQIDAGGESAYSNVIIVQTEVPSVSILPNPFEDAITIESNIHGVLNISIHDVAGRLMYHESYKSNNGLMSIESSLPPGAYIMTIQTGELTEKQNIIRK
jgi:hypothetical protein